MNAKQYTIDAKGMRLGRVASQAAAYLIGKDKADFVRHARPDTVVTIINASKLNISEKKRSRKQYPHFSGYQGGLRFEKLETLIEQKGYRAALQHAITGMIPRNKLRPDTLKRLKISE